MFPWTLRERLLSWPNILSQNVCFNFCLKRTMGRVLRVNDSKWMLMLWTWQEHYWHMCSDCLLLDRGKGFVDQSWKNCGTKNGMECFTTFWQVSIFSTGFPANVTYQELDIPLSCILPQLRCFLPNIWYSGSSEHDHLRLVALVSTTDIDEGDEVFSTYYTVIHWSFLIIPYPVGSLTEAMRPWTTYLSLASHCRDLHSNPGQTIW